MAINRNIIIGWHQLWSYTWAINSGHQRFSYLGSTRYSVDIISSYQLDTYALHFNCVHQLRTLTLVLPAWWPGTTFYGYMHSFFLIGINRTYTQSIKTGQSVVNFGPTRIFYLRAASTRVIHSEHKIRKHGRQLGPSTYSLLFCFTLRPPGLSSDTTIRFLISHFFFPPPNRFHKFCLDSLSVWPVRVAHPCAKWGGLQS